jgi:tetratricopeptide (TPR) repeat protein
MFPGSSAMAWYHRGLTPDHLVRARRFFDQAMALDPGNIEAMVGLAAVDVTAVGILLTDEWWTRLPAAEMLLTKALSLAPNHAFAHAWLGLLHMFTKRAAQGIADCENALALDRNLARAHALIGFAKYLIGRSAETEAHVNEALRLSPRDHHAHRWFLWVALAKARSISITKQ